MKENGGLDILLEYDGDGINLGTALPINKAWTINLGITHFENISKFGEMLEEISKESQIAIITHNKGTMRYGSKLIGVTSKLEGISEVVPVDLPE